MSVPLEGTGDSSSINWILECFHCLVSLTDGCCCCCFCCWCCCPNNNALQFGLDSTNDHQWDNGGKQKVSALLVGTSGAGKSTFMRQLRLNYGGGFTQPQLLNYRNQIRHNLLECVNKLVKAVDVENCTYTSEEIYEMAEVFHHWDKLKDLVREEEELKVDQGKFLHYGDMIATLWQQPCIKSAVKKGNTFFLMDNADHFVSSAQRILQQDYIPSIEDVLKMRYQTESESTEEFQFSNMLLTVTDVGGRRSQRHEWLHKLSITPTVILFLASLSEFDEIVEETALNERKNKLLESLEVYNNILNLSFLASTNVLLFLTKVDVFKRKIQHESIKEYFPEYKDHPHNEVSGAKFITTLYRDCTYHHNRPLLVKKTTTTDQRDFKTIITYVDDILTRRAAEQMGLL